MRIRLIFVVWPFIKDFKTDTVREMNLPIKLQLSDEFLLPEEICNYKVDTRMKQIWAVELDLLSEFIKVCNVHKLRYYLYAGSMLGAVRHKGVIPWDNDIDVIMPREDYNKLLTIGPKVFEKPYYFQNMATEEGKYIYFYSKLCNSHTTARSEEDYAAGQNCGIFIDIFTLDNLPDGNFARNLHLFRLRTITKMARFCCPHTFPAKQGVVKNVKMHLNHLLYYLMGKPSPESLFCRFNKVAGSYSKKNTKMCADLGFGYHANCTWNREDWKQTKEVPFNTIQAIIPVKYDVILRKQYGDYMQYPPIDQRQCHEYYDFDAETPYKDYFQRKKMNH